MTARDDYPWIARVAAVAHEPHRAAEAQRALDEIDALRAVLRATLADIPGEP